MPDQLDAMDALRVLQQSGIGMAMVHDEYGHLDGIVTPADLLTAMAGSFASHQDEGDEPTMVEREDGSLLVSGAMSADALAERLGIDLPRPARIRHRGGLCAVGAQEPAGGGRILRGPGLALRGRRHGRPPDRQAAGEQSE